MPLDILVLRLDVFGFVVLVLKHEPAFDSLQALVVFVEVELVVGLFELLDRSFVKRVGIGIFGIDARVILEELKIGVFLGNGQEILSKNTSRCGFSR